MPARLPSGTPGAAHPTAVHHFSPPAVALPSTPAAMQDYPEHRLQFFSLLRAITNHCSTTLFAMSPVGGAWCLQSAEGLPCMLSRLACWASVCTLLPQHPNLDMSWWAGTCESSCAVRRSLWLARASMASLLTQLAGACSHPLAPCLQAQLKLVIDSIVWAFRHTERNIADTGAQAL